MERRRRHAPVPLAEEVSADEGGGDGGGDGQRHGQRAKADPPPRAGVGHLAGQPGERAEIEGEVARGLESFLRFFFEAMAHDAVERRGDAEVELEKVRRVVAQDGVERLDGRLAAKRRPPGQHLVENGAEGEEIGAMVDCFSAHLLRRHVADRSHDESWVGLLV